MDHSINFPKPIRENFQDQESYEEALGFWRSRVGHLQRGKPTEASKASPGKESPPTAKK